MKGLNTKSDRNNQRRHPVMRTAGMLILAALVLAGCGQAAPTATQSPVVAPVTILPTQPPTAASSDAPAPDAITPSVTVADQEIVDGKVRIAQVVSASPGWLVVHAEANGGPGPVLGYSAVQKGNNANVLVLVNAAQATGTLYAMLHSDAGTVGTFEFPGSDGPVLVDGQAVTPAFTVIDNLAVAPTPEVTAASPTLIPPVETPPLATPLAATPLAGGGTPVVVAGEGEVELEDNQIVPRVLTVRVGTTVKFSNKDLEGHTVTSDTGLFDSGMLAKGEEFFFTFTQPGEYPYYCAPHGGPGGVGMSGVLIVVP